MIAINFAIKTNKNVFQTRKWRRNKDILGKNWAKKQNRAKNKFPFTMLLVSFSFSIALTTN